MPAFSSREEMMNALNAVIGENPSDEAVTFIANLSDTYDEHQNAITTANNKYNDLKKDYTNRFMGGGKDDNDNDGDGNGNDDRTPAVANATYETLFFDD